MTGLELFVGMVAITVVVAVMPFLHWLFDIEPFQ